MIPLDYETLYVPTEWVDEITPIPQASPDAFIIKHDDGSFYLVELDFGGAHVPIGTPHTSCMKLDDGQIVEFTPVEDFGDFVLTIHDDGKFSLNRDFPTKANCFVDVECEVFGSIGEFIERPSDLEGPRTTGLHDVNIGWSGDSVEFRFIVAPDGTPRLVEAGAIQ